MAIYASLLRYIQTINWTGYQGRLAFAAAVSIAMFIALGLVALGGKKLALGIAGGLLTIGGGSSAFSCYSRHIPVLQFTSLSKN